MCQYCKGCGQNPGIMVKGENYAEDRYSRYHLG